MQHSGGPPVHTPDVLLPGTEADQHLTILMTWDLSTVGFGVVVTLREFDGSSPLFVVKRQKTSQDHSHDLIYQVHNQLDTDIIGVGARSLL